MNRPPQVNAFFRGDPLTGKMGEAVREYIESLEEDRRYLEIISRMDGELSPADAKVVHNYWARKGQRND